jgi:O-antigen/teichoic acid export membrane protein
LSALAAGRDKKAQRRLVTDALAMLGAAAAALGLLFAAAWGFLPWARILNLHGQLAMAEAAPAAAALGATFLLGLPAAVALQIRMAFQESFVASAWSAAGAVLSLLALGLALGMQAGLPLLLLMVSGAPLLTAWAHLGWLLFRDKPWLLPRWREFRLKGAKALMLDGLLFFAIQVAGALAFQADALVLALRLGQQAVTQYAVSGRLFQFIPILLSLALTPLWPAYREAFASGDGAWARRAFWKSLRYSAALAVPAAGLLAWGHAEILRLWVSGLVQAPPGLVLALALWSAMSAVNGPLAMFLNGAGALKFQAGWTLCMAAANLALSWFLTPVLGVSGVVWGSILSMIVFSYLPAALNFRRLSELAFKKKGRQDGKA